MVKIVLLGVASVIILVFLKQSRPEYALLVKLAVLLFIGITVLTGLSSVLDEISEIWGFVEKNNALIKIMLKALGVSVTAQIAVDICKDCGENALGTGIEATAKLTVLLMALPAAVQLVQMSLGWLET